MSKASNRFGDVLDDQEVHEDIEGEKEGYRASGSVEDGEGDDDEEEVEGDVEGGSESSDEKISSRHVLEICCCFRGWEGSCRSREVGPGRDVGLAED